ncbi:MAG: hypothetical protein WC552_01490 [Candidatus Omnitrophota bacterium]
MKNQMMSKELKRIFSFLVVLPVFVVMVSASFAQVPMIMTEDAQDALMALPASIMVNADDPYTVASPSGEVQIEKVIDPGSNLIFVVSFPSENIYRAIIGGRRAYTIDLSIGRNYVIVDENGEGQVLREAFLKDALLQARGVLCGTLTTTTIISDPMGFEVGLGVGYMLPPWKKHSVNNDPLKKCTLFPSPLTCQPDGTKCANTWVFQNEIDQSFITYTCYGECQELNFGGATQSCRCSAPVPDPPKPVAGCHLNW